jgi:hypothetical protein
MIQVTILRYLAMGNVHFETSFMNGVDGHHSGSIIVPEPSWEYKCASGERYD